jgi:hypothetical protein
VEVALALGIAVFCLATMIALIPVGLKSDQASVEQSIASGFVRSIVADLRAASTNAISPVYGISLESAGLQTLFITPSGNATTVGSPLNGSNPASMPKYRASVFVSPPVGGTLQATMVRVQLTWPAAADPDPSTIPGKFNGSVDILTAIDRN